jgi:hypothetical protein
LHPARRRWRDRLPDCRLKTLELHVCRRRRVGDVPSDEVPELYHDFVRRGDPYRLVPVFHHNLLDVITMHEILSALCRPERAPERREVWADPSDSQLPPEELIARPINRSLTPLETVPIIAPRFRPSFPAPSILP